MRKESALPLWILLLAPALIPVPAESPQAYLAPGHHSAAIAGCPSIRPRSLLGLLVRTLSLNEMVSKLERGCLALDAVRFRAGQDTIVSLSPAQLAQVARALGLARGTYRVTVPAEASPGEPPDTLQARRRGARLRDELVHYGASLRRLLDDAASPIPPVAVAPGTAIPMLVRVPLPSDASDVNPQDASHEDDESIDP